MKRLFLFYLFFVSVAVMAQTDSVRKIEPGQETSFDNYELLAIALVGLLLLIGLRFWFRRTRKR